MDIEHIKNRKTYVRKTYGFPYPSLCYAVFHFSYVCIIICCIIHTETLVCFNINVFLMKSSNNYIDKLVDSNSYGKSDIEVRRKGMRRRNPMCKVAINRLYVEGPVEMDNGGDRK
jgi:hypothetical protein